MFGSGISHGKSRRGLYRGYSLSLILFAPRKSSIFLLWIGKRKIECVLGNVSVWVLMCRCICARCGYVTATQKKKEKKKKYFVFGNHHMQRYFSVEEITSRKSVDNNTVTERTHTTHT